MLLWPKVIIQYKYKLLFSLINNNNNTYIQLYYKSYQLIISIGVNVLRLEDELPGCRLSHEIISQSLRLLITAEARCQLNGL